MSLFANEIYVFFRHGAKYSGVSETRLSAVPPPGRSRGLDS